jgi:hypothetical protein
MELTQDRANAVLMNLGLLLENMSLKTLFMKHLRTKLRAPTRGSSVVINSDNNSQYKCFWSVCRFLLYV